MNLDYTIYTDKDRVEYVKKYLENHKLFDATGAIPTDTDYVARQLETLGNYILYGKDERKLTNAVQQKTILPPRTKYSTYRRKSSESLDELMESPAFDENTLREYGEKNTYLHPKPHITEEDALLPGMKELQNSIATYEHVLKIYEGKEEPETVQLARARKLSNIQVYKLKHWIIDLRKHQYYIKEGYNPTLPSAFSFTRPGAIDWGADGGHWEDCSKEEAELVFSKFSNYAPDENCEDDRYDYYILNENKLLYRRHRVSGAWQKFKLLRRHVIDFTNPQHIYQLLEHYDELKKSSWDDLNGQMKYILMDFEEIGQRTYMTPIQEFILDSKVIKHTNEQIKHDLKVQFGVDYNVNYISTIYKQTLCRKLAETAALMQKEFKYKDNPAKWKVCSCCGRKLLRDPQNFVIKSGTYDNLAARCKMCDKEARDRKKRENNAKNSK